jgi:hypothetical protein
MDGVSCESSQPLRETFILRSAVCRSSSPYEDGPSTWHSVIATLEVPASHHTDWSNTIELLPSRLCALVSICTNPRSQGRLVWHPTGSLVSLHSSRYSSYLFCIKHYIKLAAFISYLFKEDLPPTKLNIAMSTIFLYKNYFKPRSYPHETL